ncbi:AEC family transporter [Vagococcus sp.]|uniref:AEC family transporter n=1 Tax=Vagococcus sp. TaxID=1933889 RepID=UPI003F96188D
MGATVFSVTSVLILFMLVGVFLQLRGKYTPQVNYFLGYFLTNIALPPAIINSFQLPRTLETIELIKTTAFYSLIMMFITLGIGVLVAKIFNKKENLKRLWITGITFSNILFIGIPIVEQLYGEKGLVVLVVYNTISSIFLFTIGVMIFSEQRHFDWRRMLLAPAILAALIGFGLFMLNIQLPQPIESFNIALGSMTAPISMIINGGLFAKSSLKSIFKDKDNLQFAFARMVIIPVIFVSVLSKFITEPIILGVLVMVSAMPSGAINAIFAEQYIGEGVKASQYITLTTLISMVSLPLIMSF